MACHVSVDAATVATTIAFTRCCATLIQTFYVCISECVCLKAGSEGTSIRRRPPSGVDKQPCGPIAFQVDVDEDNAPRNILEEIVWSKTSEIAKWRLIVNPAQMRARAMQVSSPAQATHKDSCNPSSVVSDDSYCALWRIASTCPHYCHGGRCVRGGGMQGDGQSRFTCPCLR